jgi:hypothetical protein
MSAAAESMAGDLAMLKQVADRACAGATTTAGMTAAAATARTPRTKAAHAILSMQDKEHILLKRHQQPCPPTSPAPTPVPVGRILSSPSPTQSLVRQDSLQAGPMRALSVGHHQCNHTSATIAPEEPISSLQTPCTASGYIIKENTAAGERWSSSRLPPVQLNGHVADQQQRARWLQRRQELRDTSGTKRTACRDWARGPAAHVDQQLCISTARTHRPTLPRVRDGQRRAATVGRRVALPDPSCVLHSKLLNRQLAETKSKELDARIDMTVAACPLLTR